MIDTPSALFADTTAGEAPTTRRDLKPAFVAERIREMILEDHLRPGDPVRERTLSDALQVSRTPLREALKILASEGLVTLNPHRGATVTALEDEEIRSRLEFLGGLEAFAGKLACRNATAEERGELWALHHEMLAAYMRKDRIGYFHCNQNIHKSLVRCARNPMLIDHHGRVNAQLYRIRFECNLKTNRSEAAIAEHEEILKALDAKNEAKIARLLETHVLQAFELMREFRSLKA